MMMMRPRTGKRPQTRNGNRPQTRNGNRPRTRHSNRPQTRQGECPQTSYGGAEKKNSGESSAGCQTCFPVLLIAVGIILLVIGLALLAVGNIESMKYPSGKKYGPVLAVVGAVTGLLGGSWTFYRYWKAKQAAKARRKRAAGVDYRPNTAAEGRPGTAMGTRPGTSNGQRPSSRQFTREGSFAWPTNEIDGNIKTTSAQTNGRIQNGEVGRGDSSVNQPARPASGVHYDRFVVHHDNPAISEEEDDEDDIPAMGQPGGVSVISTSNAPGRAVEVQPGGRLKPLNGQKEAPSTQSHGMLDESWNREGGGGRYPWESPESRRSLSPENPGGRPPSRQGPRPTPGQAYNNRPGNTLSHQNPTSSDIYSVQGPSSSSAQDRSGGSSYGKVWEEYEDYIDRY